MCHNTHASRSLIPSFDLIMILFSSCMCSNSHACARVHTPPRRAMFKGNLNPQYVHSASARIYVRSIQKMRAYLMRTTYVATDMLRKLFLTATVASNIGSVK